jgi:hypothetical protein
VVKQRWSNRGGQTEVVKQRWSNRGGQTEVVKSGGHEEEEVMWDANMRMCVCIICMYVCTHARVYDMCTQT